MDTSTIAVETDSKGKIPQFLQWFDSKLHERIVYVPADTIVCTEPVSQPTQLSGSRYIKTSWYAVKGQEPRSPKYNLANVKFWGFRI